MRILVPLDGSPLAERALGPATQLLRAAGANGTILLVSVVPYPYISMNLPGDYSSVIDDNVLAESARATQEYLNTITRRPEYQDLAIHAIVLSGQPAETIITQAHDHKADLIIISSHGHTGLVRLALGSVAEVVARDGRVPTLIVRADTPRLPDNTRATPLTLLVPLDGSELAENALAPAATIARMTHGAIRLLRVLPAKITALEQEQARSRAAYDYLNDIAQTLEREGPEGQVPVTVHRALAWGDPAVEIAREAEQTETDIVVLATHGRVGLDRFLNGSITEEVLRHVALPIMVYHPNLPVKQRTASANGPSGSTARP